jgi:hypothetical protein
LQHFHLGANYLEVDLDVHNYAFIARKALWSYHDRLATVVWDMGFVIQVGLFLCRSLSLQQVGLLCAGTPACQPIVRPHAGTAIGLSRHWAL